MAFFWTFYYISENCENYIVGEDKKKISKNYFCFNFLIFFFRQQLVFKNFWFLSRNRSKLKNITKYGKVKKIKKIVFLLKKKIHIKKTASFHNFVSFHRLILPTVLTDHFYDLLLWFLKERCRCYPPWGLTLPIRLIFYILSHENGFRPKISFYSVMM